MPAPAALARSFFDAYARGDREAAASLLADDLTAYVTNASGEADVVSGREDYMARVPDLRSAGGSVEVASSTSFTSASTKTIYANQSRANILAIP